MSEKVTCEIYLVVDLDGDYGVGEDEDVAMQSYQEVYGSHLPLRSIKITAKVTPPQIEKVELNIADEAGETTQVEAAAE